MQMEMLGIWIGLIFFFLFSSCYVIDLVSEQEMFWGHPSLQAAAELDS